MDSIRPYKNYEGGIVPQAVLNGTIGIVVYASNYNDLDNKPSINSVELRGNKTAEDLGLATPEDITVTSVNNQTGDVDLTGQDIPYNSNYSLNEKINDLESQITDSGVSSVNGQTGVVTLTGTDINYSAGVSLNAKIDAVEGEIPVVDYPVTSVNGETGAVDLTGADIPMSGTDSTPIATAVGDLSTLTTNDKSSLVGAVNEIARYTPVYGNTASGAVATFDTSLALPLQDCTIAINAVQESGTPTPSSPKAISGFTGANIHVADDETPHVIDNVTAITWQTEAGTVYGGSLDVTSGVLTVDYAIDTINSSDWSMYSTWFYKEYSDKKKITTSSDVGYELKCTMLEYSGAKQYASTIPNNSIGQICDTSTNSNIYIVDTACANLNAFYAKYNGAKIIYPLATSVTYQLTPTQISAIVGTNNVFTDTNGDTSVMYACSLKDYIDRQ